ncbi:MAG: nuclear transport factor 2 family protein [Gammaproteobacteria bacterium]|nr:nuclear transport factor 2 family protein [Gammaproteobacteria bacterium]
MDTNPYGYYVDIVTKRYFHGVDNFDMNLVLDCFHEDAVLQVMTSNTTHEGIDAIKTMFTGLFDTHSRIWHGNFVHTVDIKRQSICSQFSVEVTPHGEDLLRYENCNRFYLEDGKYKRVYVYMSGENLLK